MVTLSTCKKSRVRGIILLLFLLVLFPARFSLADARLDAITAIINLRITGMAKKMPEEMKSLDATFAIAERHQQANDKTTSEQYYRLAIQKARIMADGAVNFQVLSKFEAKEPAFQADTHPLQTESSEPSPLETTILSPPTVPLETTTAAEEDPEVKTEGKLIGTASSYTVIKGDSLRLVAAKLGVSRQHLSEINKISDKAPLKIGQKLKYNNRKIIPLRLQEGIVVNIPDRTLYYFQRGKLARSLPVALGTPTKNEKYVWQTPTGKFTVTSKRKDPTWYVPSSIQAEMEEEGKEVLKSVPPGPENPLGKYAIRTSIPGILIHSTTKPWSIYSFASHGCIRVYPAQMEDFFKEVKVNTPGEIIYQPVKLAVTENGRIFLEVHQDVYGKSAGLAEEAKKMIGAQKLTGRVDWSRVMTIIRQKSGIAEDITL